MAKGVTRLYRQFVPENYQLFVDIDEKTMTFSGSVTISGRKTGRPSQRLTFHQKDLNVTEASVIFTDKKGGARPVKIDRINAHNSYDEVRLHASEMIYPGKYEVTMKFNGKITDGIHGLYPCNFVQDGKKEKLFATQFESHHAREVFPCIDEPKAKASFDLTLTTQTGVEVLSNTEIKNQKTDSGRLITSFQQTPIMSTYLLAFIFGEIHCVGGISKNGVTVRSWATVAQPQSHLQYATDEAVKILDFFENYFDTPFPLKKLDMVALPDFESGAMENWGLITYREVLLLADPINRSLPSEQTISMVIAHEMSHQWFGNLVTMSWWDDLWLNESFASIMEHLPLDALHPDWHQWEQYAAYDIPLCSGRDIYSDVQSVGIGVNHPDEISTIFDSAIVYSKGGRLIKMMREYIGEDAFKSGLKSYFKKHAYGNTYREELWDEMSLASGKDIKKLMTPWLTQSGMPVVKISGVVNGKRQLSQSRFVLDKQDDSIWPIPLLSSDLTHKILDQKTSQIDSQTYHQHSG